MIQTTLETARILIVDDEPTNIGMLRRILKAAGYQDVLATTSPLEALTLYHEQAPEIVLLDLHMPELDGIGVIERLKQVAPPQAFLPVLVLTGDASPETRRRVLAAGAKDFVAKPFEIGEVLLRIRNLLETGRLYREISNQNHQLEAKVRERTVDLEAAQRDTVDRLAIVAEFRDDNTGRHPYRVGIVAQVLGRVLGLSEGELTLLGEAAPLHDIGKIGIPDAILQKPGRLTEGEWQVMKTHSMIGAKILSGGRSPMMRLAEEIALSHHERWDGSGYPEGRAGEAIPLAARIVAVADVFDALSFDRTYRTGWQADEVFAEIARQRGTHFDPRLGALWCRQSLRRELLAFRRREEDLLQALQRAS